jgi:hypothetical protein
VRQGTETTIGTTTKSICEAHPGVLRKSPAASSDDAGFLKAEIAVSSPGRRTDNDVIDQLKLEDSTGFEDPAGEAQIRFGREGSPVMPHAA